MLCSPWYMCFTQSPTPSPVLIYRPFCLRCSGDYNLYCYYVAGLVGEGLSRLWVAHGVSGNRPFLCLWYNDCARWVAHGASTLRQLRRFMLRGVPLYIA